MSILRFDMPPFDSAPWHVHPGVDETFHVIEGRVVFAMGDEILELRNGQTITAPKAVPHSYRVLSDEAAMLVISVGTGLESLVRELGVVADGPGLPRPTSLDEGARRTLIEAAARHGITLLDAPPY